jgi:hypothetical protein
MNRILVVAALITVLTGCGDTSPFGNQRYQIVKGTHQDYLLDTKTGRTWKYYGAIPTFFGTSDYWRAIPVEEEEEVMGKDEYDMGRDAYDKMEAEEAAAAGTP